MNERRKHFQAVEHIAPKIVGNCKWAMPDGYLHAYCVAMGWEPLVVTPDGILYKAPHDFNETGTRAFA